MKLTAMRLMVWDWWQWYYKGFMIWAYTCIWCICTNNLLIFYAFLFPFYMYYYFLLHIFFCSHYNFMHCLLAPKFLKLNYYLWIFYKFSFFVVVFVLFEFFFYLFVFCSRLSILCYYLYNVQFFYVTNRALPLLCSLLTAVNYYFFPWFLNITEI